MSSVARGDQKKLLWIFYTLLWCRIMVYFVTQSLTMAGFSIMSVIFVILEVGTASALGTLPGANYGRFHPIIKHRKSQTLSHSKIYSHIMKPDPGYEPRHRINTFSTDFTDLNTESTETVPPSPHKVIRKNVNFGQQGGMGDGAREVMSRQRSLSGNEAEFEQVLERIEGSISGSVKSLVIAVIVCFSCAMFAIVVLIVTAICRAYKTEEMYLDIERNYQTRR